MDRELTIEKLGRSSRRAGVASLLGVLIVIGSLTYSALKLSSLQEQTDQKREELKALNAESESLSRSLEAKSQELDRKQRELELVNSALLQVGSSSQTGLNLVKQSLEKTIESDPNVARTIARVFIHIRDKSQHASARRIATLLQKQGFIVPGVEILVDRGPTTTQVRYFRRDEADEARRIVKILLEAGVRDASESLVAGYENSTGVKPRQYEIWFAARSL
jgi:hypothetical protein